VFEVVGEPVVSKQPSNVYSRFRTSLPRCVRVIEPPTWPSIGSTLAV